MIQLAIAGAAGRMGRCIVELASHDSRFEIAAAMDRSAPRTLPACDVLIDFTLPAGTMAWLEVCEHRRLPMVIGATGHDARQLSRITEAARTIPIVQAANFSIGLQAILSLLPQLVRGLGPGYDVEIVETHHRHKVDAPSGTAKALVDQIVAARAHGTQAPGAPGTIPTPMPLAGARGSDTSANVVCGRSGNVGKRPTGQIGVHSVRMGEIVGSHEIHLSTAGETVTIRHVAHSRDAFAAGALRAAAWIVGQPPGLYSMRDILDGSR